MVFAPFAFEPLRFGKAIVVSKEAKRAESVKKPIAKAILTRWLAVLG